MEKWFFFNRVNRRGNGLAINFQIELPINVFPFILRGVSLIGIDSQNCRMAHRRQIWQKLATDWKPEQLNQLAKEVSLDGLEKEIELILRGGQVGRVIVRLNG